MQVYYPLHADIQFRTKESIQSDMENGTNGFEKCKDLGPCQFFRLPYFTPDLFFAIDFMHCVLIGITKKLIKSLFDKKKKGSPFKIPEKQ